MALNQAGMTKKIGHPCKKDLLFGSLAVLIAKRIAILDP